MALHFAEISPAVAPEAHAVVLMDQAGLHKTGKLDMLANISTVSLPAACPELNPAENVWQFMHNNWLSSWVFTSYNNIIADCCEARNQLIDQPWRMMTIGRRKWLRGLCSMQVGMSVRGLCWAVGIIRHKNVYSSDGQLIFPMADRGRSRVRHVPHVNFRAANTILEDANWPQVSKLKGTKGRLGTRFVALRVRIADGAPKRIGSAGTQHMPGEEAWVVGEHRSYGDRKYNLSNPPTGTTIRPSRRDQNALDKRAGLSAT